jgi:hypothetical protein
MNFTHNNHLTYTIGGRPYGYREDITDKFEVDIGSVDKDHYAKSSWLEEQSRTADLIYKDYGKDFVVMFSGGTDSEIVLHAFKKIGLNPRAVFIKFTGDYNLHDLELAVQITNELDIKLEVIPFDIINFYRNGLAHDFASELQCSQMAYLSVYYHIAKLGVPAVMGGEMLMKRQAKPTGSKWFYCFRENEDASAMRFSNKYHIPLVNEWFSYTPEMMGYYLERPRIQNLLTDKHNGKMTSVSTKNSVLNYLHPGLVKKVKTTGFEKLLGFNAEAYAHLANTFVKRLESSLDGIYIEDVYKKLFGEEYASSQTQQQS